MKVALVLVCWLLLTAAAAALTPTRSQPQNIAYTHPPDTLQRDFPTVDTSPGQAKRWLQTVQLNTLSTQPRARSAPSNAPSSLGLRPSAPRNFVPGVEQWRGLLSAYGDWNVDTMLAIMRCESGGNPNATNSSSGAAGLLQIYPAQPGSYDPATNIAQGHAKWVGAGGYGPWVSSAGCW